MQLSTFGFHIDKILSIVSDSDADSLKQVAHFESQGSIVGIQRTEILGTRSGSGLGHLFLQHEHLGLVSYKNGIVAALSDQVPPSPIPNISIIRVDAQGNRIEVYFNGVRWIDLSDPDGLQTGRIGLGVICDRHAQFDDVQVTGLQSFMKSCVEQERDRAQ